MDGLWSPSTHTYLQEVKRVFCLFCSLGEGAQGPGLAGQDLPAELWGLFVCFEMGFHSVPHTGLKLTNEAQAGL